MPYAYDGPQDLTSTSDLDDSGLDAMTTNYRTIAFRWAGVFAVTSLVILSFYTFTPSWPLARDVLRAAAADSDSLDYVLNRTLGFQSIFVISMPFRSDKHDAWSVMTSLFDLDYELIDGVDGATVPAKALPYTFSRKLTVTGCWRAHMNVLRHMVDRKISTALVFEDDADWDVALRTQLVQFARGSRWLLSTSPNDTTAPVWLTTNITQPHSPYGNNWDLLWLGQCVSVPDSTDPRRFVIPDDPTVELGPHGAETQTREIRIQMDGACTAAYAISSGGARKALYHMSMQPYNNPVDLGYGVLCGRNTFTCIAAEPSIIGVHRPRGRSSKNSDIEDVDDTLEDAHSDRVVWSARMNADRLLRGGTMVRSNTGADMEIEEIGRATGHEEWIEIA